MLRWSGAPSYRQEQHIIAHLKEAEQVKKIYEELVQERKEDKDRMNKQLAEARARLHAEEQERLSKLELECAHYKVGSPYEKSLNCYRIQQMQMLQDDMLITYSESSIVPTCCSRGDHPCVLSHSCWFVCRQLLANALPALVRSRASALEDQGINTTA